MSEKTHRSRNADPIWMHLRIRYYRPSWQGGDTQHPLCMAPLYGWAGTRALDYTVTDLARNVDCPRCRHWIARGGVSARRTDLFKRYVADRGRGLGGERAA